MAPGILIGGYTQPEQKTSDPSFFDLPQVPYERGLAHRHPIPLATMSPTDITIVALLITGLIFSIIELGLSAYTVSLWQTYESYYYGSAPGFLSFLLFASLWTTLRTGFRLVRQVLRTQSPVDASGRPAAWVPILTLVINAITMIFWLAGFAAYVSLLQGVTVIGVAGALLAFAVMLVCLVRVLVQICLKVV